MATYLAFFAAGDYVVERGRKDGLPWVNAVSRSLTGVVGAGRAALAAQDAEDHVVARGRAR